MSSLSRLRKKAIELNEDSLLSQEFSSEDESDEIQVTKSNAFAAVSLFIDYYLFFF